jgi:hypothetical protein
MAIAQATRWFPLAGIGCWPHGNRTVAETARDPQFWTWSEMTEDDLAGRITASGGITESYALEAFILPDGAIALAEGCHRWAVAANLGYAGAPVIVYQTDDAQAAAVMAGACLPCLVAGE